MKKLLIIICLVPFLSCQGPAYVGRWAIQPGMTIQEVESLQQFGKMPYIALGANETEMWYRYWLVENASGKGRVLPYKCYYEKTNEHYIVKSIFLDEACWQSHLNRQAQMEAALMPLMIQQMGQIGQTPYQRAHRR